MAKSLRVADADRRRRARPGAVPADDARRCPAAAFLPTDGYIDPAVGYMQAPTAPRTRGANPVRGDPGHGDRRRRATAYTTVHTDRGAIADEMRRTAAGMWGLKIGRMVGVRRAGRGGRDQYLLTGPIDGYSRPSTAGCRPSPSPILLVYYQTTAGLLRRHSPTRNRLPPSTTTSKTKIPATAVRRRTTIASNSWPTLATKRTPVIEQAGIRTLINGPIPYSADADFVMGRAPELDNFFVATGFLYGIAAGGGAGKMMAEWILDGRPSLDLWLIDVRRFSFHHTTRHFIGPRMVGLYGHHYKLATPRFRAGGRTRRAPQPAPRPARDSGAVFGSHGGRVRTRRPPGVAPVDEPSFTGGNWYRMPVREALAVRNKVALIDQTSSPSSRSPARERWPRCSG